MTILGYIVFLGWIPAVIYIFSRLPVRQAVVLSLVAAWLFLPATDIKLTSGVPAFSKMSVTCGAALMAAVIFDARRLSSFQLCWLDIPMLIFCTCPFVTSITNALGPYDGASAVFSQTVTWGVPYYLGRVYLCSLDGLRRLAIAIIIGGLAYVPLCMIERRLSLSLAEKLYGVTSPNFMTEFNRYGGFRPEVFMGSGLMVGLWLAAATLGAIWLWQSGSLKQIWGIPLKWLALVLFLITGFVKATGAFMILNLGLIVLFVAKWFQKSFIMLILIGCISLYLCDGASGNFNGEQIISVVSTYVDQDRAGSLDFRFQNEVLLSAKARQKFLFGWGGWGRNRVYNHQDGKDISITDSFWIITFGITGIVGLISITTSILLPVFIFVLRYPASLWLNPKIAPAAAIAFILVGYMMDCLSNSMINPIYTLANGGLVGLLLEQKKHSGSRVMRLSAADR